MVQFLSIIFFSWISSIFGGFSKVPVFLCHPLYKGGVQHGISVIAITTNEKDQYLLLKFQEAMY